MGGLNFVLIIMVLVSPKTPCTDQVWEPRELKKFETMEQCQKYRDDLEKVWGQNGYFCEEISYE